MVQEYRRTSRQASALAEEAAAAPRLELAEVCLACCRSEAERVVVAFAGSSAELMVDPSASVAEERMDPAAGDHPESHDLEEGARQMACRSLEEGVHSP